MSQRVPVVGLGASAGGLEAVTRLLRALPPRTGVSFVLVQHLAPTVVSHLPAILGNATGMPVNQAKNGVKAAPDTLYIVPPEKDLVIRKGILRLVARPARTLRHFPIDLFLTSLADDLGPKAAGVILSGEASDGTLGLEAIKAAGGITFAQDRASAAHPSMPVSAAASGCADFVLPPEGIAKELTRIGKHPYLERGSAQTALATKTTPEAGLRGIFALLRAAGGVDFTHYKQTTIHRRIQRRMALRGIEAVAAYARLVEKDADELNLLFDDLLIHVTRFFRDPALFKTLKTRYIPRLLRRRRGRDPIRIWVPGCSTGEEAYSHAMNLLECLGDEAPRYSVQIFATDISEKSLAKARQGFYLERTASEVGAERLKKFFVRKNQGYQIAKSVRDLCVFARHDLTRDPPFSNMDLVSCRNVLIYLDGGLQKRVLPFLNYALKPGGLLVLGSSEMLGIAGGFDLLDKKNRIYAKSSALARTPIGRTSVPKPKAVPAPPRVSPPPLPEARAGSGLQQEIDLFLLERYTPAGVLVHEEFDILQFRGQTGPYLEPAPGKASLNLLKMAREGLFFELNSALREAKTSSVAVRREAVVFNRQGKQESTSLEVIPLGSHEDGGKRFLVLFEREDPAASEGAAPLRRRNVNKLESDLSSAREDLRSAIEEKAGTDEELRSANEELLSNNEELQSANEELETAKEELQSTNEELQSANEELNKGVLELTRSNDDMANFISSTKIPCVMLSADLNIRRFTPAAAKIFNLIPGDVGRPISHLRPALEDVDLRKLAAQTLNGAREVRRPVRDLGGRWHTLVVRPYSTDSKRIDGATIVLFDIDDFKRGMDLLERSRQDLLRSEAELRAVTDNAPGLIARVDMNLRVRFVNARGLELVGLSRKEVLGRHLKTLFGPAYPAGKSAVAKASAGQRAAFECALPGPQGSWWGIVTLVPDRRAGGGPHRGFIALAQDATARREEERLRFIFEASPNGIALTNPAGRIVLVNARVESLFGYKREELLGQRLRSLLPDYPAAVQGKPSAASSREIRGLRRDGTYFAVEVAVSPVEGEGGLVRTNIVDVTERNKAQRLAAQRDREHAQRELIANLSHEVKTPIATLRMAVETLLARPPKNPRRGLEFLKTIAQQTERLSRLVENLLELAARDAAGQPSRRERFSLTALLRACADDLAFQAKEKRVKLRLDLAPGVRISAGRDALRQTVENLIHNALQYNRPGGKVTVTLREQDGYAHVSVKDTGVGVSRSDLSKLFVRFQRTRSARKNQPSGTGLGLAIVKQTVESLNGRVWAKSRLGRGSTFYFSVPLG